MDPTLVWIGDSALASAIRDQFMPFVRAAHLISVGVMVGSILLLDLRVLGRAGSVPVDLVHRLTIGPVWAGFTSAALTGLLLFTTQPQALAENDAFLGKIGLLGLAGLNALLFETKWKRDRIVTAALKLRAAVSLIIWITAIVLSSWIPFWQFQ